jgi:lysozyme
MEDEIIEMLIRNEGLVCNPYKCKAGKLTIGVGRNLDANGISEEEALYLARNDSKRVQEELDKNWGVWRTFPKEARLVCIDCCFQMGITGWMNFRRTRALMEMGCWLESSEEILDSKYYKIDTPDRALRNSRKLASCHQKAMSNKTKRSD